MLFAPLITLAASAATALSNPLLIPSSTTHNDTLITRDELSARSFLPNVYRCDGENWKGNCYLITTGTGDCRNWAGRSGYGSFGPDQGLKCTAWGAQDCNGPKATIVWPGYSSLNHFVAEHNFDLRSWKCQFDV